MPLGVYLGFDFGFKRIGVAVGQEITSSARPLTTLRAKEGIPDWEHMEKLILQWKPNALIVGLPKCIDDREQYTTLAAKAFAAELHARFDLPVHLVDERLTTKEARAQLFESGGYRKIKSAEVDSIAACLILEQWLKYQ